MLRESRTLAIVGLSADWFRPSNFAAKYLQGKGYQVNQSRIAIGAGAKRPGPGCRGRQARLNRILSGNGRNADASFPGLLL